MEYSDYDENKELKENDSVGSEKHEANSIPNSNYESENFDESKLISDPQYFDESFKGGYSKDNHTNHRSEYLEDWNKSQFHSLENFDPAQKKIDLLN